MISFETLALAKKYTDEHAGSVDTEQIKEIISSYIKENPISINIPLVSHGVSDTTFNLTPNIYHKWDQVESLTLTLADETPNIVNQYMFSFISGETATTLILPETIKTNMVVKPNMCYQCKIFDNKLSFEEWEAS